MSRMVHLLGRPHLEGASTGYRLRSRKSWALLAYLLLSERPPTRSQLASLLFDGAEDPLGALRWSLSEIRRAFGGDLVVEGDPVVLSLPADTTVDVDVVSNQSWTAAVRLPSLGSPLLEGVSVQGAEAFESWLLSEQRRVAAASEEILHEAAVASMSRGRLEEALQYAVRLVAMTPLEENHHALLIRLYRMAGDDAAADRQFATCAALLDRELGVTPGPVVRAALREVRSGSEGPVDLASVHAVLEAGRAAVSAGAIETGADSLRSSVRLADRSGDAALRVTSRLLLAEALIHSLRGLDEEGLAALQGADDIALAEGDRASVAEARAELGYVDFLRARYDRAQIWLSQAAAYADEAPLTHAKATTYLGAVLSDVGRYPAAQARLQQGVALSRSAGDLRRAAFGLSMLGRLDLLRGDLDDAAAHLDEALEVCEREHWLAFTPWPQAWRGEVELRRGDPAGAARHLEQSFARACLLGDPCWEGVASRGLALVAAAEGRVEQAFTILVDARRRTNRLADPYVWLDGYILDAQCTLGLEHAHPDTAGWVEALQSLASRTGMRDLRVRSLVHGAALGSAGDADAARLLVAGVESPVLEALVAEATGAGAAAGAAPPSHRLSAGLPRRP
jgi:DNA-binding SARP family transcriptional activator